MLILSQNRVSLKLGQFWVLLFLTRVSFDLGLCVLTVQIPVQKVYVLQGFGKLATGTGEGQEQEIWKMRGRVTNSHVMMSNLCLNYSGTLLLFFPVPPFLFHQPFRLYTILCMGYNCNLSFFDVANDSSVTTITSSITIT